MKACITILADTTVQNYAHRIAYDLAQNFRIPFNAALYPAHISLKQPFAIEDLPRLEAYCDDFAAKITPFTIKLDEFYADTWEGNGILGLKVVETRMLRELHNRLNRELSLIFADTTAPHDGDGYRFHLTIEMGEVGESNPYLAYFESLAEKKVHLSFQAEQLGLFYSTGEEQNRYMLYKVIPLSGQGEPG